MLRRPRTLELQQLTKSLEKLRWSPPSATEGRAAEIRGELVQLLCEIQCKPPGGCKKPIWYVVFAINNV